MELELTLPSIGDVVDGRYRVTRKLGEGGTSTIFEVRHAITDKRFALKWLAPELAQQTAAVELFVHEAKVCGQLEHPNTVQIYDVRQTADSWYLLMELLEGESLETRLQRVQRFSPRTACDILLPCLEALSVAHQRGIVHLDLKPSNIFLSRVEGREEEVPKVLDFGIAKLGYAVGAADSATVSGTPLYMAPEQLMGHAADPRFDVYALGVVLYELVAGRPPYDSDDFDELVVKIFDSRPPSLDEVARAPAPFAEIVARAMAREAEDRFADMTEFAAALRPWASQRQTHSSPDLMREAPEIALDDADLAKAEPASVPLLATIAPLRPPPPAALPVEAFGEAPRVRRKRWVAVAAALSGAVLSWYGITRTTRDASLAKREAMPRTPPAAVAEVPARELPPGAALPELMLPREQPAAPSFARREPSVRAPAKPVEAPPVKPARRKPRASAVNEVASAKRERAERQAAPSTALPDVSVSRSDF
ncbi:MAG TPA: protein kinase [Polyangiales bacterium]|nr:protein kinase [Polyangiales bacterium]